MDSMLDIYALILSAFGTCILGMLCVAFVDYWMDRVSSDGSWVAVFGVGAAIWMVAFFTQQAYLLAWFGFVIMAGAVVLSFALKAWEGITAVHNWFQSRRVLPREGVPL